MKSVSTHIKMAIKGMSAVGSCRRYMEPRTGGARMAHLSRGFFSLYLRKLQ